MAEDFLPVAKPAARPDAVSAGKPVSKAPEKADQPNDVTFGELIDAATESDEPEATDAAGEPQASNDAAAAAGAAATPAPAVTPATNSILSLLQAQGQDAGKDTTEAAGETGADADAKPADAADPAVLLAQLTAVAPLTVAATATTAPTAAATAAPAAAAIAPAAPKAGQPAAAATPDAADDTSDDAAASTDGGAAKATPAAAVAAATVQQSAPKTDTADAAPEGGPGAQRSADNAVAAPAADTSKASNGQAQPSPAAAVVQPANTQAKADAPTADIKIDVAAATSTSTSTPTADALTGRMQTADAPKANPAMATASPAVAQVYTRMVERMDGRAQRFEIRLDPAELGRVDVKIEIGADQKVHAVLAAHDSASLSDLMRGQRTLERALQDAGIDLADGGLQFEMSQDRSLNGNEQREGSREQTNVWRGFNTVDVGVDADARDLAQATRSYRRAAARLDLVA